MIWKTVFIACLAVGALAEFKIPEEARNKFETELKNQCTKNGAADKYEEVKTGFKNFVECLKTLINVDTLKNEIEDAKPNGALDEVFKKYCAKSPQLKTCIHNLMTAVTPCVASEYREHIPTANNGTDQLLDFICYQDGDRIALFIAEAGPECFREKTDVLRTCMDNIKASVDGSVEKAKSLTTKEQCEKFDTFTSCVVKALETCESPTPGNMADSLFRYIKNGTPCKTKA